eukprot:snap_masked-scaffold_24-processed-gene-4.7-mRNA-1 protein AED:1.00 eAED:1.00 QI:0/-1/0/0/-1/1/1/0/588
MLSKEIDTTASPTSSPDEDRLDITEACTAQSIEEIYQKVHENIDGRSSLTWMLDTTGIMKLPPFAFQCLITHPDFDGSQITLKINMKSNFALDENAFRMSDGEVIRPWTSRFKEIRFFTNGHNLQFPKNLISSDTFFSNEPIGLYLELDGAEDVQIQETTTTSLSILEIVVLDPDVVFPVQPFFSSWNIEQINFQNIRLENVNNLGSNLKTRLKKLRLGNCGFLEFPWDLIFDFINLEYLFYEESELSSFESPAQIIQLDSLEEIRLMLPSVSVMPDNFLKPFDSLDLLVVEGLIQSECLESFINRSGKHVNNTDLDVIGISDSTRCLSLDGSVSLEDFMNDFCTVAETYEAVAWLQDFSFTPEFIYFPTSCVPPFVYHLSQQNYLSYDFIHLYFDHVDKMSTNAFLSSTEDFKSPFENVVDLSLYFTEEVILSENTFSSIAFPKLDSIIFDKRYNAFPKISFEGSILGSGSTVRSVTVKNYNASNIIPGLANLTSLEEVMYIDYGRIETFTDSFCLNESQTTLQKLVFKGGTITLIEDDAFLHCTSLQSLEIENVEYEEEIDVFKNRTGACLNHGCVLEYSTSISAS